DARQAGLDPAFRQCRVLRLSGHRYNSIRWRIDAGATFHTIAYGERPDQRLRSQRRQAMSGLLTYRGAVYPWHCDHMGHMNVMWYVGKFDEANWNLFAAC